MDWTVKACGVHAERQGVRKGPHAGKEDGTGMPQSSEPNLVAWRVLDRLPSPPHGRAVCGSGDFLQGLDGDGVVSANPLRATFQTLSQMEEGGERTSQIRGLVGDECLGDFVSHTRTPRE